MNIPKDKNYPIGSVQCDGCGGNGCDVCGDRGWLPRDHPKVRRCANADYNKPLDPAHVAIYCSNKCAFIDAQD